MEYDQIEGLVQYLQANPIVAVILVVLAVMVLGSILRKLIKAAIVLLLVLAAGLYWTSREAEADWQTRAQELGRRAAEIGQDALDKGKQLIDEGRKELRKQLEEGASDDQ